MILLILAATAHLSASHTPMAGSLTFHNGEDLFQACTTPASSGSCLGYLESVAEIMSAGASIYGKVACIPQTTSSNQLRDIALRYLQKHPTTRLTTASEIIASANADAFTCDAAAQ
jgi:hypothetical protein